MRELYDVGRVAGLDVGERRIGVAVSDATGTLARPVGVLQTSGLDGDAVERAVAELARLSAEDDGLDIVVVGLPRRLDGSPSEMTPASRRSPRRCARARPCRSSFRTSG